jgi:stage III sporulation protein SpoIIIAA
MVESPKLDQRQIIDDLDAFLAVLPSHISQPLRERQNVSELLEVVMDLGRPPEARFLHEEMIVSSREVASEDIEYVISRTGGFGKDNRAGIERTLHRISAIRNRQGKVVGLTCRVGRAVLGNVRLIEDLVSSGKSILLLGRPGIGKTTMLREVARMLADDLKKRVIVVDTSNEIAGDGDIPHPAIGHARRMQVLEPLLQHMVMIEAVENHMPEAVVIDEIGTELEAQAARTIAERGVQLIGTAHGNTLENLILNPTLSDLAGGVQTVILGDEEAARRKTQKAVLERRAPPTFDVVVEIRDFDEIEVNFDVGTAVDAILKGRERETEVRSLEGGRIIKSGEKSEKRGEAPKVYPFGVNKAKLSSTAKSMGLPLSFCDLDEASVVVTSKGHYCRRPQKLWDAEEKNVPIYVLKSNSSYSMRQFLDSIYNAEEDNALSPALSEAKLAIHEVMEGERVVELSPQPNHIRKLQHLMAERLSLASASTGEGPLRRVRIFKG